MVRADIAVAADIDGEARFALRHVEFVGAEQESARRCPSQHGGACAEPAAFARHKADIQSADAAWPPCAAPQTRSSPDRRRRHPRRQFCRHRPARPHRRPCQAAPWPTMIIGRFARFSLAANLFVPSPSVASVSGPAPRCS